MATLLDLAGFPRLPFKADAEAVIGSTYIFGEGKDVDVLVLVSRPDLIQYCDDLKGAGWHTQHEELYSMDEDNWFSARKGIYNILVTNSIEHYAAMAMGAKICKALADNGKLPQDDKWMRVIIHRALTGEPIGTNPFVF